MSICKDLDLVGTVMEIEDDGKKIRIRFDGFDPIVVNAGNGPVNGW